MQNRRVKKEQKTILEMLDELPETSEEFGTVWLHEPAVVANLYGYTSPGARRWVRKLLVALEKSGLVERRNWHGGVSWRMKNKP